MTKKTKDGMHRDIEPFPAPILTSHTGREDQLYAKDGTRLLSCSVVSRSAKEGGGNVLLISSSNPTKKDWLLPKGAGTKARPFTGQRGARSSKKEE